MKWWKRNKVEVVKPEDYTDFGIIDRKELAVAASMPVVAASGLIGYMKMNPNRGEMIPVALTNTSVGDVVGGTTLQILATALDPVVDIMVAISLPIASVIMVGAGFFFMLGNSEKGWDIIFKCGMGYIFIQIAPFLIDILGMVGEAIRKGGIS